MKIKLLIVVAISCLLAFSISNGFAQKTYVGSGDWNVPGNWSPSGVPGSGDAVQINGNSIINVTADATCASISFTAASTASTINISSGITLTSAGAITFTNPTSTSGDQSILVGSGNLIAASITMANTTNNTTQDILTVGTGTITVSGNITLNGAAGENVFAITSNGTLNIAGSMANNPNFVFNSAGATVNYNGLFQSIAVNTAFYNLTLSGSFTKSLSFSGLVVSGDLRVEQDVSFGLGSNAITTVGSTSGAGAMALTSSNNGIPANVTWVFDVFYNSSSGQTVVAGTYGNLDLTGSSRTLPNGGLVKVTGTFTAGAGFFTTTGSTFEYAGNSSQVINTTINYANLSFSGSSTKTPGAALTMNGILSIASGSTLDIGTNLISGTISSTSGTGKLQTQNTSATPIPASKTWTFIVEFNGPSQSIPASTFSLGVMCSGTGTKTATAALVVNGSIEILSGTILSLSTFALTGSITSTIGTGTLYTSNTTSTPIPAAVNWSFTVTYLSSSAQTIVHGNYTNLLNNVSGNRTLSSLGVIGVSNTLSFGAGTKTVTGSTIDFNGASQTVPFNITYNNLTCSGTSVKGITGNITVNGVLSISANVTFNLSTFTITGTISSTSGSGTLQTQNTTALPIPSNKTWAFLVEYNGASQTIPYGTYSGGLKCSGSGTYTISGGSTVISGVFTINNGLTVNTIEVIGGTLTTSGTGTLNTTCTLSTPVPAGLIWSFNVNYSSASAQQVIRGTYTNLNITGGARTLSTAGAISISAVFTPGSGPFTIANSEIHFNGTNQNVPVFNYYGLYIESTGTKIAEGNLNVSNLISVGTFSKLDMGTNLITGTLTSFVGLGNVYLQNTTSNPYPSNLTVASAMNFNGAAGQFIPAGTYNYKVVLTNNFSNKLNGNVNVSTLNIVTNSFLELNGYDIIIKFYTGDLLTGIIGHDNSSMTMNLQQTGNNGTFGLNNTTPGVTNRLKNLTINQLGVPTNFCYFANRIEIVNQLDIQSGILRFSGVGKFILLSTAAQTASIAKLNSSASINTTTNTQFEIQRFIPGGANKRRWRLLSSPVNISGSIDLTQLIDDIYISGTGGSANGFDNSLTGVASVRTYNESLSGAASIGWTDPANINSTITTGTGFEVFGRGSRILADPFNQWTIPDDATIDYLGTPNTGTINIPLSFTNTNTATADGFNLVGNPYASVIDFDANTGWTKTNMQNKFWAYNANNGNYGVYDADLNSGTNSVTQYIPSGQGFFVKADAANAAIQFTEDVKVSATGFNFFRSPSQLNASLLKIKLTDPDLVVDESLIAFIEGANKESIDPNDANKFFNDHLNLYSKTGNGTNLAINAYPKTTGLDTIHLSVFSYNGQVPYYGKHTLTFDAAGIATTSNQFILFDAFLNVYMDLFNQQSYEFEITSDANSMGNKRFHLILKNVMLNVEENRNAAVSVYPNPAKDVLHLKLNSFKENINETFEIFNLMGEKVHEENINSSPFDISIIELPKGVYVYKIPGLGLTGKFIHN